MSTCKDCNWWLAPRIEQHGPHGTCCEIDMAVMGVDKLAEMIGYEKATLKTLPDFGCVLFKAK